MKRIWFLFLLSAWVVGCNHSKKPATKPTPVPTPAPVIVTPPPPAPRPEAPKVSVCTFDDVRTSGMSFANSTSFNQARTALLNKFQQVKLTTFPQLLPENIASCKILILHVLRGNRMQMQPLSQTEQQALLNFVANGGSALILTDHVDFATANAGFLAPFNMAVRGVVRDKSTVTVNNPRGNLVTGGRFGLVNSFTQNWAGGFSRVPSNAVRVAGNTQGEALVLFDPRTISSVAGAIVFFSDVSSFIDDKATGLFGENETLFLNTIDYLLNAAR